MDTGIPFYLQIAEEMRTNIKINKWTEGQKIPTEQQLGEIFHVSRITVRKAIEELVKENLLERQRPKGTFVKAFNPQISDHFTLVKSFTEEMKEIGIILTTQQAEISLTHADKKLAQFLEVELGEKLMVLKRLRGFDKKNIGYFVTYFQYQEIFSTNARDYYGSFYESLAKRGIRVTNNKETIEAITPTQKIANLLKVTQNTPILKRTRFASDQTHNFKEYTECYYIGSEYKYFVDFK
jgi:DNA-binding GntR family transcriptional regulator